MNRRPVPMLVCGFLASALALAGCSGGGSSSSPQGGSNPAPSASPGTPSNGPSPNPPVVPIGGGGQTSSVYSVTSNPSGLPVVLDNTPQGVTPVNVTPGASTTPHTLKIGSSYTVQITQNYNGNQAIFYNQNADTHGSVNISTIASSLRSAASISRSATSELRRGVAVRRGTGGTSETRIAVTYNRALLSSGRRTASDIEHAEGADASGTVFAQGDVEIHSVAVPSGTSATAFADAMQRHPEVRSVALLHLRQTLSTTPVIPNDTHFDSVSQWDMFAIGAPNAWAYTKGDGAKIAVIDTGYDPNHSDLGGSTSSGAAKVAYAETDVKGTTTPGSATDTDGHGTNVSGIAAAITNNGFGFAGVGWNAQLLEFKIFPDATKSNPNPTADTGDEATAIYNAVSHGADVINLSIGATQDTGFDKTEHDAIEYAISHGVTVVAAAGNEAPTTTTVDYPGAYENVISVGATSLNDNGSGNPSGAKEYVASYSNYGPGLGLVAPGGDPSGTSDLDYLHWIYNISTTQAVIVANQCKNPADCKALFAGTSQATPHVSGAVALLAARAGHGVLSPASIAQLLESTADNIGDSHQGHGRLNIYRALAAYIGDSTGSVYKPAPAQFVAFAYNNSGGTTPAILDVNYPKGVLVNSDGTFEIADVPASTASFRIAVWYDANGDGKIDAGDEFGVSSVCSSSAACAAQNIPVSRVGSGFTLP